MFHAWRRHKLAGKSHAGTGKEMLLSDIAVLAKCFGLLHAICDLTGRPADLQRFHMLFITDWDSYTHDKFSSTVLPWGSGFMSRKPKNVFLCTSYQNGFQWFVKKFSFEASHFLRYWEIPCRVMQQCGEYYWTCTHLHAICKNPCCSCICCSRWSRIESNRYDVISDFETELLVCVSFFKEQSFHQDSFGFLVALVVF